MDQVAEVAGTMSRFNEQQVNYNSTVAAQAQVVEQNAKAREVRPTEEAGDSANAKAGTQSQTTTTETTIDDENVVVFTRYDSEGKEINQVPPGYDETG